MNKKMSLMGVGGKIAAVLLLSLALTECISLIAKPTFLITDNYQMLVIVAVILVAVGFTLNLVAAFGMLRAQKKGQLATGGLYALFLHPMYTCQIFLTVPGLFLLLNSWLVLAAVIPVFIAFKIFSKEEERYLEEQFKSQYTDYKQKVLVKFL